MHVAWNPPEEPSGGALPKVLTVKPGQAPLCVFLTDRSGCVTAYVHWSWRKKQSSPCGGDKCGLCPATRIWKAYVPVLQCAADFQMSSLKWQIDKIPTVYDRRLWLRKVLEVPSSGKRILEKASPGLAFVINRIADHANSEVVFQLQNLKVSGVDGLAFDPRPTMMKAWGIG